MQISTLTDIFSLLHSEDPRYKEKASAAVGFCLTRTAGSLYWYALFLQKMERNAEAKAIEDYRKKIFELREMVESNLIPIKEIGDKFDIVLNLLKTHMLVIGRKDEDRWECSAIDSPINEMSNLSYLLRHFKH